MNELHRKYRDRDGVFVAMYVREPHAGERGFPDHRDHQSFDHKLEMATELKRRENIEFTVAVDDMSQTQHVALGNLPNMAYVVGRDGRVRYSNTWQHVDDIDRVLAQLVTADQPSRPVGPTVTAKGLSTTI